MFMFGSIQYFTLAKGRVNLSPRELARSIDIAALCKRTWFLFRTLKGLWG